MISDVISLVRYQQSGTQPPGAGLAEINNEIRQAVLLWVRSISAKVLREEHPENTVLHSAANMQNFAILTRKICKL